MVRQPLASPHRAGEHLAERSDWLIMVTQPYHIRHRNHRHLVLLVACASTLFRHHIGLSIRG